MTKQSKTSAGSTIFTASIEELERRKIEISRDIPQGWLASQLAACEYPVESLGGEVRLELEKLSGGVLVRGQAHARLRVECGICLARSALDLRPTISCYMQPRPAGDEVDENGELTPEDLEREWYDGDRIVLDSLVRDAIMLELPMNPRCDGDCPGLETYRQPEPENEIDPRLAPLASIKLSKE
jgi:uncharacterized protein